MHISNFHNDKNLNVNNWGPSFWYIIHLLAFRFNKKNKNQIYYFFKYLACILPCVKCQSPKDGYPFYFNNNNIKSYMSSHRQLFIWTYNLHDYVNIKTGKQKFPYSPKDTYQMFSRLGIKYGHFVNFLINLSQVCNKFKGEKCCNRINHIIANVLFIIGENIPEFGFFIESKHIKRAKDVEDTQKIVYLIADTIYNIKRAGVYDLKEIDTRVPGGKCSTDCADKKKVSP